MRGLHCADRWLTDAFVSDFAPGSAGERDYDDRGAGGEWQAASTARNVCGVGGGAVWLLYAWYFAGRCRSIARISPAYARADERGAGREFVPVYGLYQDLR